MPFPPSYPTHIRTFYAPVDDVHGCLAYLLKAVQKSLVVAMFGFNDDELADIIEEKLKAEHVTVQLTLDKRQAAGVSEHKLLAREHYPASTIAIGTSEHGAIQHLKEVVIDGCVLITGSTNWSDSGERLQDNQLTVISDAAVCAEARARIDAIHSNILNKAKKT